MTANIERMINEKMIKAARELKTLCGSLQFEDCVVKKIECPFQEQPLIKGDKYVCLLKSFNKYPCDWDIPTTLDGWICRLDNGDANDLSKSEQVEIKELLVELKERREREDKELEERALEIERNDWEREE